jgi:hypothetical protein
MTVRRELVESRATSVRIETRVPLSLPVSRSPPVSPVSLESGIGNGSRRAHDYCGLDILFAK